MQISASAAGTTAPAATSPSRLFASADKKVNTVAMEVFKTRQWSRARQDMLFDGLRDAEAGTKLLPIPIDGDPVLPEVKTFNSTRVDAEQMAHAMWIPTGGVYNLLQVRLMDRYGGKDKALIGTVVRAGDAVRELHTRFG